MTWNAVRALSTIGARVPAFELDPHAPPTIFNFDQGLPAHESMPLGEIQRLATDVLARDGRWALEYITFEPMAAPAGGRQSRYGEMVYGNRDLRGEIARWIGTTNDRPDLGTNNVILTSGAVQAIALAALAFVDPGDGVVVEAPTFPYAHRYLTMLGADVRSVAVDGGGMDVDALEVQLVDLRRAGARPKLLYTIPTFHLPTGTCMTVSRRHRLLELAAEWDLCVVEDAIYSDLRFDGEPAPSLLSLDRTGRVIQVHAFSKVVAPGIRLGWATGTPEVVSCLGRVRTDLGVSQWMARLMHRFLAEGLLGPHLARANEIYRHRRDLAARCLREALGDGVRFDLPDGGFYLWAELLGDIDWAQVQRTAASAGILCRPGEAFGVDDGRHLLRIAYSHAPTKDMERGLTRLGEIVAGATR